MPRGEVAQKVRDVIRQLEREGWYLARRRGSHRQFGHPERPGKVTVPGQMNDDLQEGTWQSIQRQAGWRR
jgi:predicted RNA binding protein YcfA (HicA-like mRNA interferase family)